jgi:ATP-dependent protease HslVU (ClpYQ) peptidase subunit
MTTEIAILNRQAIALAADSAVTIGRQRVWKTANKLFSLAPHNDIAIMAYGSGDFISFPWETIIKCFRRKVGTKQFAKTEDCASQLVSYLAGMILAIPLLNT